MSVTSVTRHDEKLSGELLRVRPGPDVARCCGRPLDSSHRASGHSAT